MTIDRFAPVFVIKQPYFITNDGLIPRFGFIPANITGEIEDNRF